MEGLLLGRKGVDRWMMSDAWYLKIYFPDQEPGLLIQSFCVAEVLLQGKRAEKASDIDIRRGTESTPLASLIKALYIFTRLTPTTYILN